MPTYVFRCSGDCADFTDVHPMASVPESVACPECGGAARRIIGAPALGVGDSTAVRLQDATRATADNPQVVSRVPRGGRATPVTSNPLHRRLPRP
ncbi:FmdB family zinc ribbon protein [Gordonia sp. NPDC003424]